MARGGPRVGEQGRAYPNRSDLNRQPVRTATGQPYGAATEQAQAQQAVPLPQQQPPQAAPLPTPGMHGAFDRPTERPDEHVMSGVDQQVFTPPEPQEVVDARALATQFPNP